MFNQNFNFPMNNQFMKVCNIEEELVKPYQEQINRLKEELNKKREKIKSLEQEIYEKEETIKNLEDKMNKINSELFKVKKNMNNIQQLKNNMNNNQQFMKNMNNNQQFLNNMSNNQQFMDNMNNNQQFLNNMNNQMNNQLQNPFENQIGVLQMNNFVNQMQNMNMINQMNNMNFNNFDQIGNPMLNLINNMNNNMFGMSNQNNCIFKDNMHHVMTKKKLFHSLWFRMDVGSPIMIQCQSDDKMNIVVEKWCNKSGLPWNLRENYKFIFNANEINMDCTVEENGITKEIENIFVMKVDHPDNKNKKISNQKKPIFKKKNIRQINLIFETKSGANISILADDDYTFKEVALKFCEKYDIANKTLKNLKFIYNNKEIPQDIQLRYYFGEKVVKIIVLDIENLVGA